jgi:hypothetical protein
VVVQIDPAHDLAFGGCFAVVIQVRPWGVVAEVPVPDIYGSRTAAHRLVNGAFVPVGLVRFRFESVPELTPEPDGPGTGGDRGRFVERMEEWRRALGWSHARFADYLTMSRQYWYLLRTGRRDVSVGVAQRVLRERPELEHYLGAAIRERDWGRRWPNGPPTTETADAHPH